MNCPSCRAPNPDAAATCASCGRELGRRVVGPGSRIASRYELLSELGHGGMGTVFKAHDLSLDEVVALKVLRGDAPPDPGMAHRFRSEVKLAWRVRHRNVCGIHEYGEDGDLLYISMELVEGRDLKAILHDHGALPWEEAYDVALQAAEGLQAIHGSGVIHRDLKPANIIRDTDGLVRLMDFGIAKAFGDEAQSVTRTGQVVGSPEYMSPEQWRGQELDFRSDIYALGVAIFELFTGHPPFQGESPAAVMVKHLQSAPPLGGPEASRIPSALIPILERALAKDPGDRYGTCREMLAALRAAREALSSQLTDGVGPPASGPDDDVPTVLVHRVPAGPLAASRQSASVKRGPSAHSRYAKRLVPVLTRALSHERASVRAGAARAMARIGPDASAAVAALTTAVSDTDSDVRNAAAGALALVAPQGEPASGAPDPETPASQPAPAAPEASTPPPVVASPSDSTGWTVPPPVRPPPPPPSLAPARPARDPAPRSKERLFPTTLVVAVVAVIAAVTVLVFLFRARRPEETAGIPQVSPTTTLAPAPAPSPEPTAAVVEPVPTAAPTPAAEPARAKSPLPRPTPVSPRETATPAPPSPTPVPSPTVVPEPTPAPVVASDPDPAVAPTPAPPPPTREVVLPPECVRCPSPPFPEIAQRLGLKGRVRLRLEVDEKGIVGRVLVLEGPRELAEGAAKAVKKWTYRPATRNGVPIPFRVEVPLDFR